MITLCDILFNDYYYKCVKLKKNNDGNKRMALLIILRFEFMLNAIKLNITLIICDY